MKHLAALLAVLSLLMMGCTGDDDEAAAPVATEDETEATEATEETTEEEPPEPVDVNVPDSAAADQEGPGVAHAFPEPVVYSAEGVTLEVVAIRLLTREELGELDPEYNSYLRDNTQSVAILKVRVENASGGPVGFYPDQAVLEATRRASASPRLSDDLGGQLDDGTQEEGNLMWQLRESVQSVVATGARLIVDAPFDLETFEPIAEAGELALSFE
jgi:hypothetical protein